MLLNNDYIRLIAFLPFYFYTYTSASVSDNLIRIDDTATTTTPVETSDPEAIADKSGSKNHVYIFLNIIML